MTYAVLTCSPDFASLALNELCRHHSQVHFVNKLSTQHHLIYTNCTFSELAQPWRQRLPIYLHHLFPVQQQRLLHNTLDDCYRLRQHIRLHFPGQYVVQVRVVGHAPYTAQDIEYSINPIQTTQVAAEGCVLSILIANRRAYIGSSWAHENLSPWPTGRPYFAESMPNRAGLKLLEALYTFQIQLRSGDHVLDLGAAPGAWTEMLRRRHLRITAVAPTAMYDWLQDDPAVRNYTMTAEDYLTICDATYDLIVNDMILDAQDSARLMVGYARYLRPHGIAIMTLKLRQHNRRRVMDHSFRLLRKQYKIIRVRQLVSNRKEVTLFLRKKT